MPIRITKIAGDMRLGNFRLAPVVKGKVHCLHVETAEPMECAFTSASGCLVESERGLFAPVGQLISRDGEPEVDGADYVVAAKIGDDMSVPCVDPQDNPGVPAGCELGYGAILEVGGSATNVTGRPLIHFCRLEVCTTSHPHPDGAELVGSTAGPIFCYIGHGAALNDVNGHEVGPRNMYLPGEVYSHVMWSSLYEVPAAKRPATRGGWPKTVDPNTPILWRPYVAHVKIGSETSAGGGCP